MTSPSRPRVGVRIRSLREARNLTQDELAARIGLSHRQTLASIEADHRRIRPNELAAAAEALGVEVDELTDPYRLVGEGEFSFRATGVSNEALHEFERRAGRWVATYRALLDRAGVPRPRLARKLELSERSSFEEAQESGEELRQAWVLGAVPADSLPEAVERELGVLVLFVDAQPGISGAAVHLPGCHAILINRHEPAGRRNFDLAHELFHILTWDAMKPARVESPEIPPRKGNRIERLAENFAGALLMPSDVVTPFWHQRGDADLYDWLNRTALSLRVTSRALMWRLVVLGHLSQQKAKSLDPSRLAHHGGQEPDAPPPPFSNDFVARVHQAVEAGHLSLRRAAGLLGLSPREFGDVCRTFGFELSYEV